MLGLGIGSGPLEPAQLARTRLVEQVTSVTRHRQQPQPLGVPFGASLGGDVALVPEPSLARALASALAVPLAAAVEANGAVVGRDVALPHVVVWADPPLRPCAFWLGLGLGVGVGLGLGLGWATG